MSTTTSPRNDVEGKRWVLVVLAVLSGLIHPAVAVLVAAGLAIGFRHHRKVLAIIAVIWAVIAVFMTVYSVSSPSSTVFGP